METKRVCFYLLDEKNRLLVSNDRFMLHHVRHLGKSKYRFPVTLTTEPS